MDLSKLPEHEDGECKSDSEDKVFKDDADATDHPGGQQLPVQKGEMIAETADENGLTDQVEQSTKFEHCVPGSDLEDGELSEDDGDQVEIEQLDAADSEVNFYDARVFDENGKLCRDFEGRDMDDEDSLTYNELPRPNNQAAVGAVQLQENLGNCHPMEEDDDLQSLSTESDSDSDDDNYSKLTGKKSRVGTFATNSTTFCNPNAALARNEAPLPQLEPDNFQNAEFGMMAKDLQRKRSNNVWVDVWANESMQTAAQGLENFTLDQQNKVMFERGPESFSIDVDVLDTFRGRKRRHDADHDDAVKTSDYSLSDEPTSAAQSKQKTKHRPQLKTYLKTLNNEELTTYIVKRLREKNSKIIKDTIELLGSEVAIKLLSETLKIQRNGGMFVLSGARKRTPGGVFIHLLRQDKSLDEETVLKILEDDSIPPAPRKRLGSRRRPNKKKGSQPNKSEEMKE